MDLLVKKKVDLAVTQIVNIIGYTSLKYIPEDKQKEFNEKLDQMEPHVIDIIDSLNADINEKYQQKILDYQGTSRDLKSLPILGNVFLFIRGTVRPIWGFTILWFDFMVFSHQWNIEKDSLTETTFLIANFLILGFIFGERAIRNVLPIINTYISNNKKKEENK